MSVSSLGPNQPNPNVTQKSNQEKADKSFLDKHGKKIIIAITVVTVAAIAIAILANPPVAAALGLSAIIAKFSVLSSASVALSAIPVLSVGSVWTTVMGGAALAGSAIGTIGGYLCNKYKECQIKRVTSASQQQHIPAFQQPLEVDLEQNGQKRPSEELISAFKKPPEIDLERDGYKKPSKEQLEGMSLFNSFFESESARFQPISILETSIEKRHNRHHPKNPLTDLEIYEVLGAQHKVDFARYHQIRVNGTLCRNFTEFSSELERLQPDYNISDKSLLMIIDLCQQGGAGSQRDEVAKDTQKITGMEPCDQPYFPQNMEQCRIFDVNITKGGTSITYFPTISEFVSVHTGQPIPSKAIWVTSSQIKLGNQDPTNASIAYFKVRTNLD